MAYIRMMKKLTLLPVIFFWFLFNVFALSARDLPFRDVSPEELSRLQRGERVFRELDSYKDARFLAADDEGERLLDLLREVDPNFLAEILMVIPVNPELDNLKLIQEILTDVTSFDEIPYYSVDNEKWYKLFYDSEILSKSELSDGKMRIKALHRMKPFRTSETQYDYSS